MGRHTYHSSCQYSIAGVGVNAESLNWRVIFFALVQNVFIHHTELWINYTFILSFLSSGFSQIVIHYSGDNITR